ncbi:MAG: DNA adenine methylase [Phycisphaerae bacterium]
MIGTASLFSDISVGTITTEGIKYAGSKMKLLPQILQLAGTVDARTVLDGFAGTTRVSQALAQSGYRVLANDTAVWSEIFATCYLLNDKFRDHYADLIEHLNALQPVDGWFTEHYGGLPNEGRAAQADGLKKPWQIHNTRKLDAIRDEIDRLALPPVERAVAITSLILALDQVDSTLGHFASYLQDWSPRSYKQLMLKVPNISPATEDHCVYRGNIFDLLPNTAIDLAYFDPPYGSNNDKMPPSRVRYAAYYHLWSTVCLNDKPDLFGKAARRRDTSDTIAGSVFEDFRRSSSGRFIAVEAIERLIRCTNARWIILSYSSGGRATADDLTSALRSSGKVLKVLEVDYKKNVMAGMKWTNEWVRDAQEPNREFLFLIEKW